jgi:DNA ligase-1
MKTKIIKTLPRLYGTATNGKIKIIEYYVEELADGTCDIVNVHGYLDGKQQTDRRNISAGKNIGKANATSIEQQAISEMESKWQKKKDDNYTENESGKTSEEETSLLPMLAQRFTERKHHIKYPCLVQPKLDGVRSIATVTNDSVKFSSRKDKPYNTVDHLTKDMLEIFKVSNGTVLLIDGEIYKHGLTLEEINRRVKKDRGEATDELNFWVFDIANENIPDGNRQEMLDIYFNASDNKSMEKFSIKRVPTYTCNSEEEVKKYHDQFVQEGFEGVIVRNMNGKYIFDKRSNDLQKYKEFLDDEFEIVGVTSGKGREEGAIIFSCAVKNPKGVETFEVRSRGSIEQRREMMKGADKYIGKLLTVRYFALTELNVPQFPVGITVRDYE